MSALIKRFAFLGTVFVVFLMLSQAVAAQTTSVSGAMTVDNGFELFISTDDAVPGTLVTTGSDWNTTYPFAWPLTPGVINYIHVVAVNIGGPAMFIGEFTLDDVDFEFANGTQSLLTHTTAWTARQDNFAGAAIPLADLGTNADPGTTWGPRPGIAPNAQFIWTADPATTPLYFSAAINAVAPAITTATFNVTKTYSDGNPDMVDVTLTCDTGLPLAQSFSISDGNPVNFVVTNFEDGAMNCEVTETGGADGYTAIYDNGTTNSAVSCEFLGVTSETPNTCAISNVLESVQIDVIVEYEFDTDSEGLDSDIIFDSYCENVRFFPDGELESGSGQFTLNANNPEIYGLFYPNYTTPVSRCRFDTTAVSSAIELDHGCSDWTIMQPGDVTVSCTVTASVFFEGIPTLSHYGLAILVLLTLGVGMVGFRRFA